MYRSLFLITLLSLNYSLNAQTDFFSEADAFFKANVINNRVDYSKIKSDPKQLYSLLDHIGMNEAPEAEKKAYLINAYNLLVISGIVEAYPVVSPQVIPAFFDDERYIYNGEKISLNQFEKKLLLTPYQDPRLHFVLVCGAIGCPPIISEAYRAANLEEVMDRQTRLALNSDFIKVDQEMKRVELSEIFSWYASDFGKNSKEILQFINNYRNNPIPADYKVGHYNYDWNLNDSKVTLPTAADRTGPATQTNLQTFTAGSLLKKNQVDYTMFNTIYTESKTNWLGDDFSGFRNTFVTHLFQVTYGISQSSRLNVGIDINLRSSGTSTDSTLNGIKEAFAYNNSSTSRFGVTSVGARLKWQPFREVTDFSIQSSVTLPTIEHPEGNAELYWADWDRITWWNQFFYTKSFSDFQLFAEVDLLFRFRKHNTQIGMLDIPVSAFFSYFPTNKITFYVMSQHVPRLTNNINSIDTDWVVPANYTASGVGAKYQISRGLNVELLYTNFWRSANNGLGNTFNLGIKYITK